MLRRIGIYAGFALLWALVIGVVICAERLTDEHVAKTTITATEIAITGGGRNPLIDREAIEEWLAMKGLTPDGGTIANTDIAAIEQAILSHSAVASANVYTTYDGRVKIDISQREPIARLRVSGYDMYLTGDGFIMPATDGRSVLVPVITGDYKPLFDPAFKGYVRDVVRDSIAALDRSFEALEAAKLPHYEALQENNRNLRKVTSQGVERGIFTSDEEYEILAEALKEKKSSARLAHSIRERDIREQIAAIEAQQAEVRHTQKEVRRTEEDVERLIGLLLHIREDRFWSAEVVQLVATGDLSHPLQLEMVPRSGRFLVDLGTTERLEAKLRDLRRFYSNGLDNVGWDRYKSISLRYEGQVVCR